MANICYLTILSLEGEVYGEFADATWIQEDVNGQTNHIFSGLASDGTVSTFERLDDSGVDRVTYRIDCGDGAYEGPGRLLAPDHSDGSVYIRVEALNDPLAANS
jgi:hypothetical protein